MSWGEYKDLMKTMSETERILKQNLDDDYEYRAFTIITLAMAVMIANVLIILHMKYGILNWLNNWLWG